MPMLEQLRKIIGERLGPIAARLSAILGDGTARARTALAPTIAAAHGRYQKLEPRERLLEQVAGGLKQYTVGLKLNGLSLPQIVDTLYGLNSLNVPVTVSTLHVTRRSQDQHTFDVEMTCVALGRNG